MAPITYKNVSIPSGINDRNSLLAGAYASKQVNNGFDALQHILDTQAANDKVNAESAKTNNDQVIQGFIKSNVNSMDQLQNVKDTINSSDFIKQFGGKVSIDAIQSELDKQKATVVNNLVKSIAPEAMQAADDSFDLNKGTSILSQKLTAAGVPMSETGSILKNFSEANSYKQKLYDDKINNIIGNTLTTLPNGYLDKKGNIEKAVNVIAEQNPNIPILKIRDKIWSSYTQSLERSKQQNAQEAYQTPIELQNLEDFKNQSSIRIDNFTQAYKTTRDYYKNQYSQKTQGFAPGSIIRPEYLSDKTPLKESLQDAFGHNEYKAGIKLYNELSQKYRKILGKDTALVVSGIMKQIAGDRQTGWGQYITNNTVDKVYTAKVKNALKSTIDSGATDDLLRLRKLDLSYQDTLTKARELQLKTTSDYNARTRGNRITDSYNPTASLNQLDGILGTFSDSSLTPSGGKGSTDNSNKNNKFSAADIISAQRQNELPESVNNAINKAIRMQQLKDQRKRNAKIKYNKELAKRNPIVRWLATH